MFAHNNPLRNRLSPKIIALATAAGFNMLGQHNQRQSFYRKLDGQSRRVMQHIEVVENGPSELVVVYESADEYGTPLEDRIKVDAPSLLDAMEKALAHAEESHVLYQFHGVQALKTASLKAA